jgi:hypothetical protein
VTKLELNPRSVSRELGEAERRIRQEENRAAGGRIPRGGKRKSTPPVAPPRGEDR